MKKILDQVLRIGVVIKTLRYTFLQCLADMQELKFAASNLKLIFGELVLVVSRLFSTLFAQA